MSDSESETGSSRIDDSQARAEDERILASTTVRLIAPDTPSPVKALLASDPGGWVHKNGQLAIEAVKKQLEVYNKSRKTVKVAPSGSTIPSLFDTVAQKVNALLLEDPDNVESIKELVDPILARAMYRWESIPYTLVCGVRNRMAGKEPAAKKAKNEQVDTPENDIDHWIIRNESWLRAEMDTFPHWPVGLVALSNMDEIWETTEVSNTSRKITRGDFAGFTFLNKRRSSFTYIQPSLPMFERRFHEMTYGQLDGLDWSNIFVAGGMVLGTLLGVEEKDAPNTVDQWKGSDIDIYVYGLHPAAANEKIRHIYEVFKANLPADAPCLVTRNSKTISFLTSYPNRRFQIILKKVRHPKEVLLNFDLDICAVGYDGKEVWMLPRMVRALETGYNTFTMDMLQGHYLGDRRATQEQRVFKYANKGYGIRILPSYLEALAKINPDELPKEKYTGTWKDEAQLHGKKQFSLEARIANAQEYFERIFEVYMRWSNNGRDLQPSYIRGVWNGTLLRPTGQGLPVFTHALLDTRDQLSSQPQPRSCLTGFELLYRHVALWEAEQAGRLIIQDDIWASSSYDEVIYGVTYEETPKYPWDPSFNIHVYEEQIKKFNEREFDRLGDSVIWLEEVGNSDLAGLTIRRMAGADTYEDLLMTTNDLIIPVWLPNDFFEFAQHTLADAFRDTGLSQQDVLVPITTTGRLNENLTLTLFKIIPETMWQQVDRRIDEVYEVLWSFMHSNSRNLGLEQERTDLLKRQLSHRSFRKRSEDEYKAFAMWVRRNPGSISGESYGAMGQGFWWEVTDGVED